jgi:hypothetical protein
MAGSVLLAYVKSFPMEASALLGLIAAPYVSVSQPVLPLGDSAVGGASFNTG